MKLTSGVDFTNILQAAFVRADPISVKMTYDLTAFFAFLGSMPIKAACKHIEEIDPCS